MSPLARGLPAQRSPEGAIHTPVEKEYGKYLVTCVVYNAHRCTQRTPDLRGTPVGCAVDSKAVQRLLRERQPHNSKEYFGMNVNPRTVVRIDEYRRRKLLDALVMRYPFLQPKLDEMEMSSNANSAIPPQPK
eukprot:9094267-Pyramimonas_sp.AAC.1